MSVRFVKKIVSRWGILPFPQRKKLLEKYSNKKRQMNAGSTSAQDSSISRTGSRYCLLIKYETAFFLS